VRTARLITRSLWHYWKTGAVVAFGVAVATAVIVGSLVVGDSVTGSIRDTALDRLGRVTNAMVAPRFFSAMRGCMVDVSLPSPDEAQVRAVILTQAAASNPDTSTVIPGVSVIGTNDPWLFMLDSAPPGKRNVVVNRSLADDLGVQKGSTILLNIGKSGHAPADTLFGRRERRHTMETLRVRVAAVLQTGGDFSLRPGGETPRNLFISRNWLATRLGQRGKANALMATGDVDADLKQALKKACRLSDHGLKVTVDAEHRMLLLKSAELLIPDAQVETTRNVAEKLGTKGYRTSVYLADTLRRGDHKTHYAVVCGFEPLGSLKLKRGWLPKTGSEFILANTWVADDLKARAGDLIDLSYRVATPSGAYAIRTRAFTYQGTVELVWPVWNTTLVPDFDGITDAEKLSEWDPPFPIDSKLITDRDEAYWQKYRTSPKAFLPLDALKQIWADGGSPHWVTSVRVPVPNGEEPRAFAARFVEQLTRDLDPADSGLVFRPVRDEAFEAAKGSTPFGTLFLSMGMFLVASGMGLAGMLMRLSIERRSGQMGMLLACGFEGRRAARLMATEGAVLAVIGALLGTPLGILYAHGIIHALRTWWAGAVGNTTVLWVHVTPTAVLGGLVGGLAAGLLSVWLGVRRLRRRHVLELLSGWQSIAITPPSSGVLRAIRIVFVGSALGAASLLGLSIGAEMVQPAGAFFGVGALLLVAGLSGLYLILVSALKRRRPAVSLSRLALRNASGHRGRSMLAAGLLACASFVIVAVAANERNFSHVDPTDKASGTGGFTLRAESSLPIHYDFGTKAGREELGFAAEDEPLWKDVRVYSFLRGGDEDISCLNLATANTPRVLGVPPDFVERGGFTVKSLSAATNPWTDLGDTQDGDVPTFGDSESVMWKLLSGLGKTMTVRVESGEPTAVRFTGLISSSVLAGELLVSQRSFKAMFPSQTAPRYFLIETPAEKADAVAVSLRRNLGEMGVSVRSTLEVWNDLIGVQNAYLMTFLALGGLGVVLGTVGLVVVVLRNALERRGEFALMLATGFGRGYLAGLLIVENVGLLLFGLIFGALSALVAVAPQLASVNSSVNWATLIGMLAGIMAVGIVSCVAAAAGSVRTSLIEALRSE
jgi:putative ABC transport system permease protein